MAVGETYKYLGIQYSALGVEYANIYDKLKDGIRNLEASKLNTFQRFIGLRDHLIPRLLYPLTYGKCRFRDVKGCDLLVLKSFREWTKLSHDTPKEFYHARVADSGLGLRELLIASRTLANGRARALRDSSDKIVREACKFFPQITEVKIIQIGGLTCSSSDQTPELYKKALYKKINTQGLESSQQGHKNFSFLTSRTMNVSDLEFAPAVQIMAGSVTTKSKIARFKTLEGGNKCESCADKVKNLAHILQVCPRVHGARTKRHDAIQELVERSLTHRGIPFTKNNVVPHKGSCLKPDLIIRKDGKVYLADPTIVSDNCLLSEREEEKCRLYGSNEFKDSIIKFLNLLDNFKKDDIVVVPLVFNWRGVMSKKAYIDLHKTLGIPPMYINYIQMKVRTTSHSLYRMERERPDRRA
uniref:Reverse transcriptase n=1 Tax=Lepeophtheirus salmonis TaxID=72036 RepID=A0A0K2V119_LEPSM